MPQRPNDVHLQIQRRTWADVPLHELGVRVPVRQCRQLGLCVACSDVGVGYRLVRGGLLRQRRRKITRTR